jgi:PAS domain S-box-containing protein
MTSAQDDRLISSYKSFASYFSLFVIVVGLLVIYGWVFNIPFLKSILPDLATMKVNAALCFVLSGIALWLGKDEAASDKKIWIARGCAVLVTMLGLLTLGEFAFRMNFGIDQLLFKDIETPQIAFPGRIGFTSAINFVLIGVGLYVLTLQAWKGESVSQPLALVAGIIALLALIGYLYDVESLHRVGRYSHMALHSAINFIMLAVGICCARPQKGLMKLITTNSVESKMVRRLLSVLLGIPIILGWLTLWGERLGMYDPTFALALMVILTTVLLSFVVWWNAGWLRRIDTERKQAEDELRYQARVLRRVSDAVIATDEQLHITSWNRAAEKMYGWKASEVIGRNASEIVRSELTAEQRAETIQHLQENTVARSERLHRRRDGEPVYVEANTIALTDEQGKLTGFISVNRDITERRQVEAAVAAGQRRLQALVEHAPDGIALLGLNGKLQQVTPSTEQILGYTLAEAVDQDPALLTHPEDLPALLGILNDLIQNPGQVVTTQYRFKHKDGSWRWLESTISNLIAEPSVQAIVFNYRDITAHKQAQEEVLRLNEELEQRVRERTRQLEVANHDLDNSRKEIQAILDSMSTLNAKVALDGTLLFVNKIAIQASGLSVDELMKTNFLDGQWWAYDLQVQQRVKTAFEKACSGLTINYDEKIFVFGQILTINFSLTPMLGEEGQVEYILAEGRDITRRIHAEEEIRRLNQDLVHRAAELEIVNKELESFSYSVSHDLRAPLRSINGFSYALLEDYSDQLSEEGQDYLTRIQAAAQRMGELVDSLLSLARVTRTPVEFRSVNLSNLAEKILTELQSQQPNRRVTFSVSKDLIANGDRQLLQIALENLIGNAWKFTSKREDAHIEVGAQNESGGQIYFVRDNGAGFDMTYKDKLFGTFQRLHSAQEYSGTGIGLATVQRIIHRHGGHIWAESEVDQGTTFYFTIGDGS